MIGVAVAGAVGLIVAAVVLAWDRSESPLHDGTTISGRWSLAGVPPLSVTVLLAGGVGLLLSPVIGIAAGLSALGVARLRQIMAARREAENIDRELPYLLDIAAAASTAGLSVSAGFAEAAGIARGPLGAHVRSALADNDLGLPWHDALQQAGIRADNPDLQRLVAALRRSETLGVPLASTLVPFAAEVRARRLSSVMERARKAPVKMLFPLIFLVLPAFLLLTVVPMLVSTFGSIR